MFSHTVKSTIPFDAGSFLKQRESMSVDPAHECCSNLGCKLR